jgi:hypothetical protein
MHVLLHGFTNQLGDANKDCFPIHKQISISEINADVIILFFSQEAVKMYG